jgi:hypothetical protein
VTRHKYNQNPLKITSQGQTPDRGLTPPAILGQSLRDSRKARREEGLIYSINQRFPSPKISESGFFGVSVPPCRVFETYLGRFPSIGEGITFTIGHSVSVLLPFIAFARLFGVISAYFAMRFSCGAQFF